LALLPIATMLGFMDLGTNKTIFKQGLMAAVRITRPMVLLVGTLLLGDFNLLGAAANGAPYQVIKSLEGLGGTPTALIEGRDGRLYGALEAGGSKWEGVVFALNQDGSGYAALHSFKGASVGGDGSGPQGLIEGSDGVLYGTTKMGGTPGGMLDSLGLSEMGNGTVFRLNKDGSGYAVLRRFTGKDGDASQPWQAGVVEGRDGALYGTTLEDGREHQGVFGAGHGTIFKLNKDGSAYRVLHMFGTNQTDGHRPFASLLSASDGALYGTTDGGGDGMGRNGIVFKMNLDGSDYRVLHSFPTVPTDGRMPRSALVEGADGALYGTTQNGGPGDYGTIFKLNTDGSGYKVLHSFTCSFGQKPNPQGPMSGVLNGVPARWSFEGGDGATPQQLVVGTIDGTLYGAAQNHGKNGSGTVFALEPNGNRLTVLHDFPGFGEDGSHPSRAITRSRDGALYGITNESASNNSGAVFKLSTSVSLSEPPQVKRQPVARPGNDAR
jgi:uncharacterized repeat protein (TIGR03803 family)